MESFFVCPHFKLIEQDKFNLMFSKAAGFRQEQPEIFNFTHTPITVYDKMKNQISEDELINQLLKDAKGNRVFAIEGDTGTGKSELCVKLAFSLQETRKVLHISKNEDLMRITSETIPV